MKFATLLEQRNDGCWALRHDGPEIGSIVVTAPSREAAVEKLRGEIRYRLELCPCSGDSYQHIDIEIIQR